MKKTGWFFCSFLLVSTSLAYAADKEAVKKETKKETVNNTEATVNTEDFEKGKKLHDEHCMACHTRMNDDPYKIYKPPRKVQSWNSLKAQVHRCDSQLDLGFFDDEIKGIVHYLNHAHYEFEKTSNK